MTNSFYNQQRKANVGHPASKHPPKMKTNLTMAKKLRAKHLKLFPAHRLRRRRKVTFKKLLESHRGWKVSKKRHSTTMPVMNSSGRGCKGPKWMWTIQTELKIKVGKAFQITKKRSWVRKRNFLFGLDRLFKLFFASASKQVGLGQPGNEWAAAQLESGKHGPPLL